MTVEKSNEVTVLYSIQYIQQSIYNTTLSTLSFTSRYYSLLAASVSPSPPSPPSPSIYLVCLSAINVFSVLHS